MQWNEIWFTANQLHDTGERIEAKGTDIVFDIVPKKKLLAMKVIVRQGSGQ